MEKNNKKKQIFIEKAAPILNTANFSFAFGGQSGKDIPLNEKGHPYCFEWIALAGMHFEVAEEIAHLGIYRILCPNYPHPDLYIDARFTKDCGKRPFCLQRPKKEEILSSMEKLLGTPYVWGGNWSFGIPEMLAYYPPNGSIDEKTKTYWTLSGVDCSGLLFQTTNGTTPRNTSELIHFGTLLQTQDQPMNSLLSMLRPLDMLIYLGHVVFILDSNHTIESKFPFGVIRRNLKERIEELLSENRNFMIRRWI